MARNTIHGDESEAIGSDRYPTDLGLDRIIFLSDGVFAIAMTLLVIDLRVPDLVAQGTSDQVTQAVGDLLPRLLAYAGSFTIISFFWVGHWRRFKLIDRADTGLAYVNLLLLAFIALIPFPTALIGEHGDVPIAVAAYAVTLSAAGIAGFLSWIYARRAGLLKADAPVDLVRSGAVRGLAVSVVMLGSLVLLPVASPYLVEASWALIMPAQALISMRASRVS